MLRPFVADLPTSDMWQVVNQAIAGEFGANKRHTFQTLDDCASFAANQFLPADGVLLASDAPPCAPEEAKAAIAALADGKSLGVIPWLAIAFEVAQLLAKLLKK